MDSVLRTLEELAEAVSGRRPSTSAVASAETSRDDACPSNRTTLNGVAAGQPSLAVILDSLSSLLFLHPEQQVMGSPLSLEGLFALHDDLH